MKLLVPLNLKDELLNAKIAPQYIQSAVRVMKLLMKLLVPLKFKELVDSQIATGESPGYELFRKWILPVEVRLQLVTLIIIETAFPLKVMFPVNIRLLS